MGHQLWAKGNPSASGRHCDMVTSTAMGILLSDNITVAINDLGRVVYWHREELLDGLKRGSFRFSPIDNPPIGNTVKAGGGQFR